MGSACWPFGRYAHSSTAGSLWPSGRNNMQRTNDFSETEIVRGIFTSNVANLAAENCDEELLTSDVANFLHLSKTSIRSIRSMLATDEVGKEPLNQHQCRSMSTKLERTMENIEVLFAIYGQLSSTGAASENLYRVFEKAKELVKDCCNVVWCQASAFQIQNEDAFKEIILETSLCYNTIYVLASDINQNGELLIEDLRQTSIFEPPAADAVHKDRIALFQRLKNMSSSSILDHHLAKYLLERLSYLLEQSVMEGFDVCISSLWPDGKGPDGEWSNVEIIGNNVWKTIWLGVPCARKMFFDEVNEKVWRAETKILASLNHPNIVKFLCSNQTKKLQGYSIAMEHMTTSLSDFIKKQVEYKKGKALLTIFQTLDVILQITYGMCYLHDCGIAHRDLKTSNVVVSFISTPHLQNYLQVKLVDFGLSKMKLRASKSNTVTRPKIGTTMFRAPEAFVEGRVNWLKADVYSFAIMCSEILSGVEPFREYSVRTSLLHEALLRGVRPLLPADTPEDLVLLITECWATNRDLRPDFVDICTRLEKLKHKLLREHTLGRSLTQEEDDSSNLHIEKMLKARSDAREKVRSQICSQLLTTPEEEVECNFNGEEVNTSDHLLIEHIDYKKLSQMEVFSNMTMHTNRIPNQEPILPKPKSVVGLDFGATFCGFSYAHASDPTHINIFHDYPNPRGEISYCKTLIGSYYKRESPNGGQWLFQSWGYPACAEYERDIAKAKSCVRIPNKDPKNPTVGTLFTEFKLYLAEDTGPSSSLPRPLPPGMTANTLITDYLRGLGAFIVKTLQTSYGPQLTLAKIQWCLAVPCIWTNSAKETMKTCMTAAGLVDGADGSPHPLIMVLEPEAASFHCHKVMCDRRLEICDHKRGDKLLVADIGGGTTDIVVQEVVSLGASSYRVKEVMPSSGGLCGGTHVDTRFMEFLHIKIGPCLQESISKHPSMHPALIKTWQLAKTRFGERFGDITDINLPTKLAKEWEKYDERMGYPMRDDYDDLEVSYEEMQSIFDPVVEQNLELISDQLDQVGSVKVLAVVGGFVGSPYMMDCIKRRFSRRVPEIIRPPSPGSAICQGIVAMNLHRIQG